MNSTDSPNVPAVIDPAPAVSEPTLIGISQLQDPGDVSAVVIETEEEREYRDALERDRLNRLAFLETQFSVFNEFIKERRNGEQKAPARKPLAPLDENNNDGGKKRTRRHGSRNKEEVDVEALPYFTESPPFIKNGVMRPYQVQGLNWLISLYERGINGILADEMGLGKTLQSISILGYLKNHKNIKGKHIVIVPLTTIDNWMREFARFLPELRILRGHCYKPDKKAFFENLASNKWDVVVTNYDFFVLSFNKFKQINYQYVILDEAQRGKNEHTRLARFMRQLTHRNMLFLTGTPINNNLHELWALLNLLLPEFFQNADDFDSWFKMEDCIDPNHERAVRLKSILEPIMLRRIKADVEAGLLPKMKTTLFMPQTRTQRYWSKRVLCRDVPLLKGDGTYVGMTMGTLFVYLREITIHPYMIPPADPDSNSLGQHLVDSCSRMIVLDKLLTRLKARGSRVLLFSQFVLMLNILEDYLVWKGYKYSRLTGTTPQETRQQMIDEFNSPGSETFIFMITTRSGGLGINLPTADTVIFYDLDWNPQADFQAEDRAHRIGQLKQVHVFRFVILGTVDEAVYGHSQRKTQLDKAIVKKSLGDSDTQHAVEYHRQQLESGQNMDPTAVDGKLDEIFAQIDGGERSAALGNLCQEIHLKALRKRTLSEDEALEAIKPPAKKPKPELDLTSGYRYRPRRAKKVWVPKQDTDVVVKLGKSDTADSIPVPEPTNSDKDWQPEV
uniref:SWI/SNF-related matrix-associated actin-dependent regulator of chromatin subfamily A member 5 n=1 Tax=Culex pipiens TaxID=7175 RepID=A0A8D8B5T0_CULPI